MEYTKAAKEMTVIEKIRLLNTLHEKVIDYSCSAGECEYVHVPLDDDTRDVLHQLGKDDKWIDEMRDELGIDEDIFDISVIGFEIAEWWSVKEGFS